MSDGTKADLSKAQILYSSDDEQIAAVDDNGVVHGVGEGTATITATVMLNDITAQNSVEIAVDYLPPVTTVHADGTVRNGWYTTNVTVTLEGTDNRSGIIKWNTS